MNRNLCSVIIPMFNCAETISKAIQSAQNQTYSNLEILAIDDHSSDNTVEIVENLATQDNRIHIIQNKTNLGVSGSRNVGFEHTEGGYIAFLDGDDIWEADKLKKQITLFQDTKCDFCYTSYSYINDSEDIIGSPRIVPETCTYFDLLKENFICCSSVLLRSELTRKHKMTKEFFHEDFIYWLELLKSGCTAVGCGQVLVKYRVSQKGRSSDKKAAAKNRWQVYRKYCKMNMAESYYYFFCYAVHGLKKYHGMTKELPLEK